jgi:hypothetical protein
MTMTETHVVTRISDDCAPARRALTTPTLPGDEMFELDRAKFRMIESRLLSAKMKGQPTDGS